MSDKQERQIVDIHSHIFWYPDHLSLELVTEALAAKKVKIEKVNKIFFIITRISPLNLKVLI